MDVLKKQTVPLLLIGIAVLYIFVAGLTSGAGVVASTLFGNLVLIAGFTYLYRYDRKKPDYEEVIDSSIIKQYYGKDITIIYILIVLLWFVGQFVFLWFYLEIFVVTCCISYLICVGTWYCGTFNHCITISIVVGYAVL